MKKNDKQSQSHTKNNQQISVKISFFVTHFILRIFFHVSSPHCIEGNNNEERSVTTHDGESFSQEPLLLLVQIFFCLFVCLFLND